ncbi:hypothetical protein Zmor_000321 [Zophobas morio]|uniref:Uncharacterized protein n=1 Tax=Zophobas morio TaxID=2755281 RepID=A0AA38MRM3_9CUCU|nr:hypothetical protein Zmor_000321 [Zophobas morio]
MYQLVAVVCSVNVFDNGGFFQFKACQHGSAFPYTRTFTSMVQHLRDRGTFKPQTQDCGRDRTDRIHQAEDQISERVEEEPDISTRQRAAKVGVSPFIGASYIKNLLLVKNNIFNICYQKVVAF